MKLIGKNTLRSSYSPHRSLTSTLTTNSTKMAHYTCISFIKIKVCMQQNLKVIIFIMKLYIYITSGACENDQEKVPTPQVPKMYSSFVIK